MGEQLEDEKPVPSGGVVVVAVYEPEDEELFEETRAPPVEQVEDAPVEASSSSSSSSSSTLFVRDAEACEAFLRDDVEEEDPVAVEDSLTSSLVEPD